MTATLCKRLEAVATRDADGCVTVEGMTTGGATLTLPDRTLVVVPQDGPAGADHWTVELLADGATVSKFGPFESVESVLDRVRTLLDSEVRYTVCCDG